jgi:hypothetical protein
MSSLRDRCEALAKATEDMTDADACDAIYAFIRVVEAEAERRTWRQAARQVRALASFCETTSDAISSFETQPREGVCGTCGGAGKKCSRTPKCSAAYHDDCPTCGGTGRTGGAG